MASPTLLEAARLALRISATDYDDKVEMLVDAAVENLRMAGVASSAVDASDPDAPVKGAILVYCKAQFGMDNPDAEKYMAAYNSMAARLALSAEYGQPALAGITGDITAGSADLTVDDAANIAADNYVTVAGAGVGGGLLLAKVAAVADPVVTLSRAAATTVTDAAVTVR